MAQIAGLARAVGIKVLLSGEGADELFGGYDWTDADDQADFSARGRQRARRLARFLLRRGRGPDPRGAPAPEVASYEAGVRERALGAYGHHRAARRRLEAGCLTNLGCYLPHLLNRQEKNTMQRSIETRVPFLDPDVVGLALNLPLEVRVQPRRKPILRELGARHLPPEIGERPKVGFGFDVVRYLTPAAWSEFLADGLQRDMWGVPAEEWRGAVAGLTGHAALCFWMGEIWARGMLDGRSRQTIEAELWT
jgi:asparagine synthase (glutamine-hydrolysing)